MFHTNLKPPKNINIQKKPPLHRQDIAMPHFENTYAHHARAPNTNYAEKSLQYRLQEESAGATGEEQVTEEMHRMKAFAEQIKELEHRQMRDRVHAKFKAKIQEHEDELELRRYKLRNLMAEEEEIYIRDTVDKAQRGDESKFANMKQRSDELKAAKEAERLEIVKQKRIQQYSLRCVELRPFLSRKLTEESKMCQLQQMRENEARRQSEAEINRMWDNLLKKQDEAFMEREVQEAIIKYNRSKKDMDILTMQIRAKKERDESNRELERMNFEESMRIIALQNKQEQDEMQRKCEKRLQDAEDLKRQIEIQQEFMKQRKKEEVALDNAFAKLAALELKREKDQIVDSKDRLHKEMETYKHHLEHLKQQRKEDEDELNRITSGYQKEAQQKQDQVHCKYVADKMKLKEEVMKKRAEQVQNNRIKVEKELECKKIENQMMRDIVETNKRLHDETESIRKLSVKQYRNDLNQQIEYNYLIKKRELEDAEKRLQQGLEEERKLEALVNELIEGYESGIDHPFRRILNEYDCKCNNEQNQAK